MKRNRTKLYYVWLGMKQRCNNPNNKSYKNYGAKGIKVCEEWRSYDVFAEWANNSGYREGLTIERIDVKQDYTPNNCCWVKLTEQHYNKTNTIRCSNGRAGLLVAKENGISAITFKSRIDHGWDADKAATEPKRTAHSMYENSRLVEYNGEIKSVKEWCEELGLCYSTVWKRIKKGQDAETAFFSKSRKQIVVYKGKEMKLSECQRLSGLSPAAFYGRLRKGWSLEDAIETPNLKRGKLNAEE